MADNLHLTVKPPKDEGGFYTIEDSHLKVLAWDRTLEEIAIKWRQMDSEKTIVEGLRRQSSGSSLGPLSL